MIEDEDDIFGDCEDIDELEEQDLRDFEDLFNE